MGVWIIFAFDVCWHFKIVLSQSTTKHKWKSWLCKRSLRKISKTNLLFSLWLDIKPQHHSLHQRFSTKDNPPTLHDTFNNFWRHFSSSQQQEYFWQLVGRGEDAVKHLTTHMTAPLQQRSFWSKVTIMLRVRNLAIEWPENKSVPFLKN